MLTFNCLQNVWHGFDSATMIVLNIAGIPRMSSVTIFQTDHFVLSTNLLLNLTFRSP